MFEHLWCVDHLQRLGISRYFHIEIDECVKYVYIFWTNEGIGWARNINVEDVDDTALGFRLLRLHGYDVAIGHLKPCSMEKIYLPMQETTAKFLHQKRLDNAIVDKWIITKDLPVEVQILFPLVVYALDVPFYASLPRLEARLFLEQYGGDDDVWIGKTLYRWYGHCNLMEFGLSERRLLLAYYIAASSAFEPEKSRERLAWAKTRFYSVLKDENGRRYKTRLVDILINTVSQFSSEILVTEGRHCESVLIRNNEWQKWLKTWEEGSDLGEAEARLLLQTIHLSSGLDESSFSHPKYNQLLEATCKVCHQLCLFQNRKMHDARGCITDLVIGTTFQIGAGMQDLVKLVFTKSAEDLDSLTKQSFFTIARSFYYAAYCDAGAINSHIDKVLFQKID
ncbi:hypothetical protein C2S52_021136 [Perilla frutescens var. hirtella]|nr:hypothetical protein C2S52_021136 [Perilla frutescens var. hirtella]